MKRAGFTFIELLMALMIFSAIAATVQLTLQTGIAVFRRGRGTGGVEHRAYAALDLVSRQIRAVQPFAFQEAVFLGESQQVTFPARVLSSGPGEEEHFEIGLMSFGLDEGMGLEERSLIWKRTLLNREKIPGGENLTLMDGVESLTFLYGGYPGEEGGVSAQTGGETRELVWTESWEEDTIPIGLQISLTVSDPAGGEAMELSKMLYPATGGLGLTQAVTPLIPAAQGDGGSGES